MDSAQRHSPERQLRPTAVNSGIALLLLAAAAGEAILGGDSVPPGAAAVAVTATTVPLAWRSLAPLAVTALTSGGLALGVGLGFPAGDLVVPYLAPLVALYSVGLGLTARGVAIGAALAFGLYSVAVAAGEEGASELAFVTGGIAAALAVGRAARVMGFESDALEARAAELESTQDEATRAAVAAERARIARELHDVIGHSISVMGIQAGAVRRVLPPELGAERESLLSVERTGRDAVTEMRRLLGFLRPAEGETSSSEPPPTLHRLEDLVGDLRLAGLDVDLTLDGDLDALSPGRALTAFRIVQEALTNALRHAAGSRVRAILRQTADSLVIEVADSGGTAPSPGFNGGGYGLLGMRERVALYGGTLDAGPAADGGFVVRASIPTGDG